MMRKLVLLGLAMVALTSSQKVTTAQSQMIHLNIAGGGSSSTFFIQGTTRWAFDDVCAGTPASELVNTLATIASTSCTGGLSPCNPANAPATTPTPTTAEILAKLTSGGGASWSNAEKATFYCGGTITRTGTLQLTSKGLDGSGTWKFNYDISASTETIAPKTCWVSETATNGVNINYNGFAAGESVQKRNSGSWRTKYSFSMLSRANDGSVVSRCVNTVAYLEVQGAGGAWSILDSQSVDTSNVITTELDNSENLVPFDVFYYGNAGQAGGSAALSLLHAPGRKSAEFVSTIVKNDDDFAGNDADLCQRAILQGAGFNIKSTPTPGVYQVRVTGTIKGNVGTVDAGFNVATSFNVIGEPTCT